MAGFVNIPFNPANDPLTSLGSALGAGAGGFAQGLVRQRQMQQQGQDVQAIKQWVDGGMEGPPPSTSTDFGQQLTGKIIFDAAAQAVDDPDGKTLRANRQKTRAEAKRNLAMAQFFTTGGKPLTATDLRGHSGAMMAGISRVKSLWRSKWNPWSQGRKQAKFIEGWENFRADPATDWDGKSRAAQIQLWNMWNTGMEQEKAKDEEVQWNPNSKALKDLRQTMFGKAKLPGDPKPEDAQLEDTAITAETPAPISGFIPEGGSQGQVDRAKAGLNVESLKAWTKFEDLWKQAKADGNERLAAHYAQWLSLAVQAAEDAPAKPPVVAPNTPAVPLKQHSSPSQITNRRIRQLHPL